MGAPHVKVAIELQARLFNNGTSFKADLLHRQARCTVQGYTMSVIDLKTCGVSFGTSGVRGLVDDLDNHICYAFARAFIDSVGQPSALVIGHDLRPSSPRIAAACAQACRDLGIDLVYVGALPTPAIAFYAMQLQIPSIVITGSHIPFDRNGIKFYRAEGEITKEDEASILGASVNVPDQLNLAALPIIDARASEAYLERYLNFFPIDLCEGMRVAVYQHSGVGRDLLADLFEKFGAQVIRLGRADVFVPIDTEAVRPEDVAQARLWAGQHTFDLIVSTDGDADRPLIGDEQGNWLRGDLVGVLCGKVLGVDTLVTPVSSNTVLEQSGWFKHTLRTRIGSPYVLAAMSSAKGIVAGYEANGGFLLASDIAQNDSVLKALPTRDAILPMLAIIALAKKQSKPVSALVSMLPARYTASDRIPGIATEWSQGIIKSLNAGALSLYDLLDLDLGDVSTVDATDGFRTTFASGDIVHLRPSGNAPELRCYVESDSAEAAQHLCTQVLANLERYYQAASAS